MIVVVATQNALESDRVAEREDGGIPVHRHTPLLGVDKRLARCIAEGNSRLCSGDVVHPCLTGSIVQNISQFSHRPVVGVAQLNLGREGVVGFVVEGKDGLAHERHLIHRVRLEREEHIVLVRHQILVRRGHHVVLVRQCHRTARKFERQALLLFKRVLHLGLVLGSAILEAVCHIAIEEQVRIERSRGLSTQAEAESVNIIARHKGVHRPYVKLARLAFTTCFDKILNQCPHAENQILEPWHFLEVGHKGVHILLFRGQRHRAVTLPKYFILDMRVLMHLFLQLPTEKHRPLSAANITRNSAVRNLSGIPFRESLTKVLIGSKAENPILMTKGLSALR